MVMVAQGRLTEDSRCKCVVQNAVHLLEYSWIRDKKERARALEDIEYNDPGYSSALVVCEGSKAASSSCMQIWS